MDVTKNKLICFTLAPTPELSSENSSALGEKNSPGDTSGPWDHSGQNWKGMKRRKKEKKLGRWNIFDPFVQCDLSTGVCAWDAITSKKITAKMINNLWLIVFSLIWHWLKFLLIHNNIRAILLAGCAHCSVSFKNGKLWQLCWWKIEENLNSSKL